MDISNLEVRLDKPYPEIENVVEDKYTVGILKNLVASKRGELSDILQYVYQAVVADGVDKEIGGLFEEIAIVEMMHLEMLMMAIAEFGGLPKYEDANGVPFNVTSINYTIKLKDMLEGNIYSETTGAEIYRQAGEKVKNESLKNLLNRIAEDEDHHANILKEILNNVKFLSI